MLVFAVLIAHRPPDVVLDLEDLVEPRLWGVGELDPPPVRRRDAQDAARGAVAGDDEPVADTVANRRQHRPRQLGRRVELVDGSVRKRDVPAA